MKKTLLCLLLLFYCAISFSQNWQTVVSTRQAFFKYGYYYTNQRAIRIDSIEISGTDSIFRNYKAYDDYGYLGFCQDDTTWLGHKIIIKSNGDNIFITASGDSVLIRTIANLNDSWMITKSLQAIVTAVHPENVLGVPDSVKEITIQNGEKMKISRNYGIINLYPLNHFPSDTVIHSLTGISQPALGIQNLKPSEVFNFSIGDTFQYSMRSNNNYSEEYSQISIMTKSISSNNDTLIYSADRMLCHKSYYPQFSSSFKHDTIALNYILSEQSDILKLPHELLIPNSYSGGVSEFPYDTTTYINGRRYKILSEYYNYNPTDSCLTEVVGWCIYQNYGYADGLGLISVIDNSSGFEFCWDYHIVYYHKGSEKWGTPLDWSKILAVGDLEKSNIKIYPNPFSDALTLSNLPINASRVIISDILGRILLTKEVENKQDVNLLTTDLAKGVYNLNIIGTKMSYYYKLIKE